MYTATDVSLQKKKKHVPRTLDTMDVITLSCAAHLSAVFGIYYLFSSLTHLNNTLWPLSHETAYYAEVVDCLIETVFPVMVCSIHFTHSHTHLYIHFQTVCPTHTRTVYMHTLVFFYDTL